MKKHDEGYVLVYVMVVLLVFCLVATTILTGALRSLNAQQDANEQMQHRYVAAGEIEKVLAQWEESKKTYQQGEPVGATNAVWHEMELDEEDNTLYVFSSSDGNVMIICRVYENGTYYSYEVSTVTPVEDEEVYG